jgi:hypothetical protein
VRLALNLQDKHLNLRELRGEPLPWRGVVHSRRRGVGIDANSASEKFLELCEELPEPTVVHMWTREAQREAALLKGAPDGVWLCEAGGVHRLAAGLDAILRDVEVGAVLQRRL